MSLIQCHECKKLMSESAEKCPHCGGVPLKLQFCQVLFGISLIYAGYKLLQLGGYL